MAKKKQQLVADFSNQKCICVRNFPLFDRQESENERADDLKLIWTFVYAMGGNPFLILPVWKLSNLCANLCILYTWIPQFWSMALVISHHKINIWICSVTEKKGKGEKVRLSWHKHVNTHPPHHTHVHDGVCAHTHIRILISLYTFIYTLFWT